MRDARGPVFRPLAPTDDGEVAALIRKVMGEFSCDRAGLAVDDPEIDTISATYAVPGARFYVVEENGQVRGCGGYGPLQGSDTADGVAELRKMYFRPSLRGHGVGRRFLVMLLAAMAGDGYRTCYLETTSGMDAARHLYVSLGFLELPGPLGATGHFGCDRWFSRPLERRPGP